MRTNLCMDQNAHAGVGRRPIASSYMLELVPDVQGDENRRHRVYHHSDSVFQLPSRSDDHRTHNRQDFYTFSQVSWGGGRNEERLPVATTTKRRLSQPKRRSLSTDQTLTTSTHDNILYAESPLHPGVPILYRPPEEKSANPDRLNLDRRHLTMCPILEGEERLRLLNLQHNSITRLQNLSNLRRLVFLDLYDNMVRDMSGLDGLLSLRVLMLGKNRIHKISGLHALMRLDVLDLHGNQVKEVDNICHLSHLRVLNLAGNEITCVSGLMGLNALAELNLRRNRITHVYEIDQLTNLQRLFLSHNLIQSFTDMSCLAQCTNLHELSLDGNPVANNTDHRQSIIYHVYNLKTLDQSPVLEEEREETMATLRQEEEKLKEERRMTALLEYRDSTIIAIQRSWDISHTDLNEPISVTMDTTTPLLASASSLLPTFLVDLAPPTLHLYGVGALDDLATPPRDNKPITSLHFHCIEFNDLVPWINIIQKQFPNLESLCLENTNLSTLDQINHLSLLPTSLHTLTISPHGNHLITHPLFTHYTLYRLCHHLNLSILNEKQVTQEDMATANRIFKSLEQLSQNHLPLTSASFTLHQKLKNVNQGNKLPHRNDRSFRMEKNTCRVGFSDTRDKVHQARQAVASSLTTSLRSATIEAHKKLTILQSNWNDIITQLVQSSLREYSQLDETMAHLLDHI